MEEKLTLTDRTYFAFFKEQLEYIDGGTRMVRRKIFNALVSRAVTEMTTVKDKRCNITLNPGQCLISEVELAKVVRCNRKTVHATLVGFERLGISESQPIQQRTSLHTLHCITSWRTGTDFQKNSYYERSASEVIARVNSRGS